MAGQDDEAKGFEEYGYPIGTPAEMLPPPPPAQRDAWAGEVQRWFFGRKAKRLFSSDR